MHSIIFLRRPIELRDESPYECLYETTPVSALSNATSREQTTCLSWQRDCGSSKITSLDRSCKTTKRILSAQTDTKGVTNPGIGLIEVGKLAKVIGMKPDARIDPTRAQYFRLYSKGGTRRPCKNTPQVRCHLKLEILLISQSRFDSSS